MADGYSGSSLKSMSCVFCGTSYLYIYLQGQRDEASEIEKSNQTGNRGGGSQTTTRKTGNYKVCTQCTGKRLHEHTLV